jgi:hypothetical protein
MMAVAEMGLPLFLAAPYPVARRGARMLAPATFPDIVETTMARGTWFDCGIRAQTMQRSDRSSPTWALHFSTADGSQCDRPAG